MSERRITRRDYRTTSRLWGLCETCRCTWHWNGLTENVDIGERMVTHSACLCPGAIA